MSFWKQGRSALFHIECFTVSRVDRHYDFYDGALAANGVLHTGAWIWCLVIGVLIILWILIGITNLGKINTVAMAALFVLTLVLCKVIFFDAGGIAMAPNDSLSFGAAVELAVAMPLSWLPLISDYTREAEKPFAATMTSTVVYGIVSTWMYVIGMGAAIFTGEYDIAQIMVKAGLGIAGLFDRRILHGDDNLPGRLFCRHFGGVHLCQVEWKVDCSGSDHPGNHLRDSVSDGRHYQLPLSDRFRLCADDRDSHCRFLCAAS